MYRGSDAPPGPGPVADKPGSAGTGTEIATATTPAYIAIAAALKAWSPTKHSIGVGWSTHFERGWKSFYYRKLRYAYRAPAFFAEAMLAAGANIKFLRFDEGLSAADLDGTSGKLAESVEIFYCASHGEYKSSSYSVILCEKDWKPCARGLGASAGLGTNGPSVAVFDTCDLLDPKDPNWPNEWVSNVGLHLRLVLGFASPATVAADTTVRGKAFAEEIIKGNPIGPSWLRVNQNTKYPGTDRAVAIGFGDNASEADWALHKMKLGDLPCPRKISPPVTQSEVWR